MTHEKIQRALTFRAALDQKLNAIARAFGSWSEGARQIKVSVRSLGRWRAGHFPEASMLQKIDDVYAMAVELLNNPGLIKEREKADHKVRSLARKLKLSESSVRLLKAEGLY